MRYIIETNKTELISQFTEDELVDQYEPIEKLTARVEKIHQAFNDFKKTRGSWQIMNYYLRGRGISQAEIDKVLSGVEEFLKLI